MELSGDRVRSSFWTFPCSFFFFGSSEAGAPATAPPSATTTFTNVGELAPSYVIRPMYEPGTRFFQVRASFPVLPLVSLMGSGVTVALPSLAPRTAASTEAFVAWRLGLSYRFTNIWYVPAAGFGMETDSLAAAVAATMPWPSGVMTTMSKSAFSSPDITDSLASGAPAGTSTVLTKFDASAAYRKGPGTSSTADESALDRPSSVTLVGELEPETMLMFPEPLPPCDVKAMFFGATTDCGRTEIGDVTVLLAPCQVREPMANCASFALWFSNATLNVRFSPAAPKVRTDGVTVTFTPGT